MAKSVKPLKPSKNLAFKQLLDILTCGNALNDKLSSDNLYKELSQILPDDKVTPEVVMRFQEVAYTFILMKQREKQYKRREQHLRDFNVIKSSLIENMRSIVKTLGDLHCDHPDVLRAFLKTHQVDSLPEATFQRLESCLADLFKLLEHAEPLNHQKKSLTPHREAAQSLRNMYKTFIYPKIDPRKGRVFHQLVSYFFRCVGESLSEKSLYLLITKS